MRKKADKKYRKNKKGEIKVNQGLLLIKLRNLILYTKVSSYHTKSNASSTINKTSPFNISKKKANSSLNNNNMKDLRFILLNFSSNNF